MRTKKWIAALMAMVMILTSFPLFAFATDQSGTKPEDGTNAGRPFVRNSPSELYRIPGLVTMNDGTLVAVSDIGWNGNMDGGGKDTIVARSTNNGSTWDYTVTNYYPDNGNVFDKSSTSVCDSEIATDGKKLYLLTTFFPAGYALNGSSANNTVQKGDIAFDSEGRLKLTRSGDNGAYNYYLGEFGADGYARIYSYSNNSEVSGYTVDHDFYLYVNGQPKENLFYSDCEFQTYKTTFLLFRTSDDNGASWSDFTLLNVKKSDEGFYGVGPGRGLVTKDGTLCFSMYKSNAGDAGSERSSFIYSKDGGKTWTRTDDVGELKFWSFKGTQTSENQLVELDDGTIRMFSRAVYNRSRIIYSDAKLDANGKYTWSQTGVHLDQKINGKNFEIGQGTMYSAIKYSKKLLWNGGYYSAIIVSSPATNDSKGNRLDGIFTILLMDDNNNFVNAVQYPIATGNFWYSCLTELDDGRIAILYEQGGDGMPFKIFNIEEISGCRVPDLDRTYEVALIKGDSKVFLTDEGTCTNTDPSIASVDFSSRYGTTANMSSDRSFTGEEISMKNALYDFIQTPDGTWYINNMGVYMTIEKPGIPSRKDKKAVTIRQAGDYFQFIDAGLEALYFWSNDTKGKLYQWDRTTAYGTDGSTGSGDYADTLFEVYRPAKIDETVSASDTIPGYVRVTNISQIADGGQYIIGRQVDGVYYFLYPSLDEDNLYTHTVKCTRKYVESGKFMKFNALKSGETTVVCGRNTYNITVSDFSRGISGVVDYDPVIYTHGTASKSSEITTLGNQISDGSVTGEKKTEYRMRDNNYTITQITAVTANNNGEYEVLTNTDIVAKDGKLTGTLDLATTDAYKGYDTGTYVTLKTELRDSEGLLWIQTDKLYVASNPVPGHLLSLSFAACTGGLRSNNCSDSAFLLADGSYGNTYMTTANTGAGYRGNANKLFNEFDENGNIISDSLMLWTQNVSDDAIKNIFSSGSDNDKSAGALDKSYESKSSGNPQPVTTFLTDSNLDTQVAYYYYDKSSPKNEGIIVDPNDDSNFSIFLKRQIVNIEYEADDNWQRTITVGNDTSVRKQSGAGSITEKLNPFGTGTYTVNDTPYNSTYPSNYQQVEVKCSTKENGAEKVAPNTTESLRGILRYNESARSEKSGRYAVAKSDLRLTFEIKMCDKSKEREAFNGFFIAPDGSYTVRKSTWYTVSTWKTYMSAVSVYQEYLNNYTLLTTADTKKTSGDYTDIPYEDVLYRNGENTIQLAYNKLHKRADFTELDKAIENSEFTRENGIVDAEGKNYTPSSYISFVSAYDDAVNFLDTEREINGVVTNYNDLDARADLPGYLEGPDTDTSDPKNRLEVQELIDGHTDDINNNQPVLAADDEVYVAAKAVSAKIDKYAYKDNADKVTGVITNADDKIYMEYDGIDYVNVPDTAEGREVIDDSTRDLLTEMNVGKNAASQVKQFHVTVKLDGKVLPAEDGTVELKEWYNYGETAHIDLTAFKNGYTVKCEINSDDTNKAVTKINLEDCGYYVPVLIQEDLTIDVEIVANPMITVVDYYNTVIAALSGNSVLVSGDTLTIGDSVIKANQSPKYTFVGWSLPDGTHEITEPITITQMGELNTTDSKDGNLITAVNGGTVNGKSSYTAKYVDLKLSLASADAKYWTRKVGNEVYLASYAPNFVVFSANEDVEFTPYSDVNEIPYEYIKAQIADNIPAVYGAGYFANDRFTLSVDYSAPKGVKVLDAGVIYSTTASTYDDLVKGGTGARVIPANEIAHWNDDPNASAEEKELSGTFTMFKNNSTTGTYYMRAYVSYTSSYEGSDVIANVPYVVYSDKIYKCVDGKVSVVE